MVTITFTDLSSEWRWTDRTEGCMMKNETLATLI